MIELKIDHAIRYRYSQPVFLEPTSLRLQPRSDVTQSLLDFSMKVSPEPTGRSECVDLDGNVSTFVWFEGLHEDLAIEVASCVEMKRTNPFDYLISEEDCAEVPVVYSACLSQALLPYLQRSQPAKGVEAFAKSVASNCGNDTLVFLSRLCDRIATESDIGVREEGDPQSPEDTLRTMKGACRDLSVLFMDACRSVGLASRFVSGYQEGEDVDGDQHLHAWAEVYLPGGGWRGYDPTNGIAVADRHVALAAAARSELAAPTSGAFRGTGATCEMSADLSIRTTPINTK